MKKRLLPSLMVALVALLAVIIYKGNTTSTLVLKQDSSQTIQDSLAERRPMDHSLALKDLASEPLPLGLSLSLTSPPQSKPLELPPLALEEIPTADLSLISEKGAEMPLTPLQFKEEFTPDPRALSSDDFFISVEYAPKTVHSGYVFRITFHPKPQSVFNHIPQNYIFLIDRSHDISRHRFVRNKMAVLEAIEQLSPGDTFNIIFFDDRVGRLSTRPLPYSAEHLKLARTFLENEAHGGHFSTADICTSLGRILPIHAQEEAGETFTTIAILLTDGDTFLNLENQRLLIKNWTERNKGQISLFCVASGDGNNLPLLDLLSSFNKGALIYASDPHAVSDKLKHLITSLQTPIGKEMVATAIPSDKNMQINLQPKNRRLGNFYRNRPFTIWGSTNRLSDFTLFLQGMHGNQPLDIKKKIVFKEASKGNLSIEREWTMKLAGEYYDKFFQEGKTAHLDEAKKLLAPFNLPNMMVGP